MLTTKSKTARTCKRKNCDRPVKSGNKLGYCCKTPECARAYGREQAWRKRHEGAVRPSAPKNANWVRTTPDLLRELKLDPPLMMGSVSNLRARVTSVLKDKERHPRTIKHRPDPDDLHRTQDWLPDLRRLAACPIVAEKPFLLKGKQRVTASLIQSIYKIDRNTLRHWTNSPDNWASGLQTTPFYLWHKQGSDVATWYRLIEDDTWPDADIQALIDCEVFSNSVKEANESGKKKLRGKLHGVDLDPRWEEATQVNGSRRELITISGAALREIVELREHVTGEDDSIPLSDVPDEFDVAQGTVVRWLKHAPGRSEGLTPEHRLAKTQAGHLLPRTLLSRDQLRAVVREYNREDRSIEHEGLVYHLPVDLGEELDLTKDELRAMRRGRRPSCVNGVVIRWAFLERKRARREPLISTWMCVAVPAKHADNDHQLWTDAEPVITKRKRGRPAVSPEQRNEDQKFYDDWRASGSTLPKLARDKGISSGAARKIVKRAERHTKPLARTATN
ncbi:MAG: hypothetical protein IID41_15325 [Planctomycetes bacterium]|nr:hypothetical protein [Planctomycetota bacterium]